MAKSIPISATASFVIPTTLPLRNTLIKGVTLAGAAATSVLEIFDGAIDSPEAVSVSAAGQDYSIGDVLTLVAGENGSSASRTVVRVTQIDFLSPSSSISSSPSSSPSSSVSLSTSPSASSSVSTSISTSISPSPSPSTSISSSPSPSASPSTSISASPSPSASPSTSISSSRSSSISSSLSSSVSTSISSSASASPSPSGTGSGGVTEVEIITRGGGYTAGNVYATTTDDGGTGATIKVLTVSDEGTSVAKLQCVANESAPPIESYCGILTTKGISARISGTSAKGHLIYE